MTLIPPTEMDKLWQLYKSEKTDVRVVARYHALYLESKGYTFSQLRDIFGFDENTIRFWARKYLEGKRLEDKPRPGRKKKLTEEVKEEVFKLVDENKPEQYGFHTSLWTCKELRIYLKQRFGFYVSDEAIRKILAKNGFSYIKAEHRYISANVDDRRDFINNLVELTNNTQTCNVYFSDEMHANTHPKKGYGWTRTGRLVINTPCIKKGMSIIGAVNPKKGKVITSMAKRVNSHTFIDFLKKLLSHTKGIVVVVLDNAKAHVSKLVKDFVAKQKRLKLLFLPGYSPDLNPKENFWNFLRKKFLNNRVFKTTEEMCESIDEFIASIKKSTIRSVCSSNYLFDPGRYLLP